MMEFHEAMPFESLSFEAQLALQSQASRRPPAHPGHMPFQVPLLCIDLAQLSLQCTVPPNVPGLGQCSKHVSLHCKHLRSKL